MSAEKTLKDASTQVCWGDLCLDYEDNPAEFVSVIIFARCLLVTFFVLCCVNMLMLILFCFFVGNEQFLMGVRAYIGAHAETAPETGSTMSRISPS